MHRKTLHRRHILNFELMKCLAVLDSPYDDQAVFTARDEVTCRRRNCQTSYGWLVFALEFTHSPLLFQIVHFYYFLRARDTQKVSLRRQTPQTCLWGAKCKLLLQILLAQGYFGGAGRWETQKTALVIGERYDTRVILHIVSIVNWLVVSSYFSI